MTDQPKTEKSTPRRRRAALAAPLVVVATAGLAAGCSSSPKDHPMGMRTQTTTSTTALRIGDNCGNGVFVLGMCAHTTDPDVVTGWYIQTVNPAPDDIIATGTYVPTTTETTP